MGNWLEDAAPSVEPSEGILKTLSVKASLLDKLRIRKEEVETILKSLNEEIRILEQEVIPSIMNENGVASVRIAGVGEISTKVECKASITDWYALKDFLQQNGFEELAAKEQIVIAQPDRSLVTALEKLGVPATLEPAVHYQTLNKFARDLLAEGRDFPVGMSVFKYFKTVVNRAKA